MLSPCVGYGIFTGMTSLAKLPDLFTQTSLLLTTRTPGTTEEDIGAGKTASDPRRAPLRLDVLDVLIGSETDVCGWGQLVAGELRVEPPVFEMVKMCRFLEWAVVDSEHAIPVERTAKYWENELKKVSGEGRKSGIETATHVLGCGSPLVQEGGLKFNCSGCGESVNFGSNLDKIADQQNAVPLALAAEITGVPLSTLKYWVKKEQIHPIPNRVPRIYPLAQIRARVA